MRTDSDNKDLPVKCALYFVLGGWLTFFAIRTAESPAVVNARETCPAALPRLSVASDNSSMERSVAGVIQATQIPFSHPDGVFPDRGDRLKPERWIFKDFSEKELAHFFASCDLRPAERATVLDRSHWSILSNACVIMPPSKLIWSLSPRGRQQIYSVLAKDPENYPQFYAFRFPLRSFNENFRASGIPQSTI